MSSRLIRLGGLAAILGGVLWIAVRVLVLLQPPPFSYDAYNRMCWVVERTSSWHNAHKKLVWCTERRGRVDDFWIAFSEVVIVVRRLIRERMESIPLGGTTIPPTIAY